MALTSERTEPWTYGGVVPGKGAERRAAWYDPDGKRHTFAVDKGQHYVVGGVYELRLADAGDGKVTRLGRPAFLHRHPDPVFAAQVEAAAYAADRSIAVGVMERRMARDGGQLGALIAPLVKVATGMPYPQRDALIALVTREVYRARAGGAATHALATERENP